MKKSALKSLIKEELRAALTEAAKEVLVFDRTAYSGDGKKLDRTADIQAMKLKINGSIGIENGSPGSGRAVYRITRIDGKGVWGTKLSDNRRVDEANSSTSSELKAMAQEVKQATQKYLKWNAELAKKNKKMPKSFMQTIKNDVAKLNAIAANLSKGDAKEAYNIAQMLDTLPRETIPQRVWQFLVSTNSRNESVLTEMPKADGKTEAAIMKFVAKLQKALETHWKKNKYVGVPQLSIDKGSKYWRIVKNSEGSRSVYCFVDISNGNILKPAGFKAPETKNPRGNVFDADNGLSAMNPYGTNYIKGPNFDW
jgi:hypothetical protein